MTFSSEEIQQEFDELQEEQFAEYEIRLALQAEWKDEHRKEYEEELKHPANLQRLLKRRQQKCAHVKRKEALDNAFKEKRRQRSREYAACISTARLYEHITLELQKSIPLPGFEDVFALPEIEEKYIAKLAELKEKIKNNR